ncbi:NAD/NADP transhydrogenase alpha subunit-like protein [Azospirillum brasilense]|uniref:NAD/NADP transhydrogenase alpha subunit-like protein n=2 Tax=Azospirillum brasilense TaxID=192 RepID=UPI001FFFA4F9|nr:NAD/NADP transhydrogenase alpha subunit-like protein [Azospirillum brasilense]
MQSFITEPDAMGRPTSACTPPASRMVLRLAAGVPKSLTVPTGARIVLFNGTGPFWVQYGANAALPNADVLTGAAPELAPAARNVQGIGSLGLIAPADCTVSIGFSG